MKLTNQQMDEDLYYLHEISAKVAGKLGYYVAKNARILTNELVEYGKIKDNLIKEYGTADESGRYSLSMDSPNFAEFATKLQEYSDIECNVNLMMIDPEIVYDSGLNGQEISSILFMIKDEEVNDDTQ